MTDFPRLSILFFTCLGTIVGVSGIARAQETSSTPPPKQSSPTVPSSETVSSSPVPFTSTLYPGSTVRAFHGKDNFGFRIESDFRYRSVTGPNEKSGTYISAGRFTGDWVRANPQNRDERGGVRIQALLETDQRGTVINKLRLSEAYGYYTFLSGGVSARARVGQFVLPFGLLAVYDTALQPVQSLYEKSLGLRVDSGVMLEGRYDEFHYAGSITTGTGPNGARLDRDTIVAFRLSRFVTLPKIGPTEVGGSLLSGKIPVTDFKSTLFPSGAITTTGKVKVTRVAADAQLFRDPWILRGELVFGGDEDEPVYGYYAEGNYRATHDVSFLAYSRRWDFPKKLSRASSIGVGAQYTPPVRINAQFQWNLRAVFEYERNISQDTTAAKQIYRRLTFQTFVQY